MPVFEFDELANERANPTTGDPLMNYWGYNPIGFFAPNAAYAESDAPARELKTLVKQCHSHGIEVWLDVVFNHTAEGNENGPTISYRGIDNKTYYLLKPDGGYYNFSGTGNTFNCNHPIVRVVLLDCLRYWVSEFHIDGFRFDLASSLGRDPQGNPDPNPPLLEVLAYDPMLAQTKLIAEAWDAGGLVPGRRLSRVRPLGGMEWQVSRRSAAIRERRRRHAWRHRRAHPGLARHVRRTRPARIGQLHHRARRFHAARPGLLQ